MNALLLSLALLATPAPIEVDAAEVIRLGDFVQHVDGIHGPTVRDTFVEAMGPPETDSHKWFVSVIEDRGPVSARLREEWASSAYLRAFAVPGDPAHSWAHFNRYDKDDASQAFRWEGIKLTGFPAIIVQPPRNRKYGPPEVVVYQRKYDGRAEKTARGLVKAIREFIARRQRDQFKLVDGGEGPKQAAPEPDVGRDPPWLPQPPNDQPPVTPQTWPSPFGPVNIPPVDAERFISIPWGKMLALFGITGVGSVMVVLVPALVWGLRRIREERKLDGDRLLIEDDELFERIIDIVEGIREMDEEQLEEARVRQVPRKRASRKKAKRKTRRR